MSDYWLTLRVEDKHTVHIERANTKSLTVQLDFSPLREATIHMFETWLADDKITERIEVEVLGTHLYEAMFSSTDSRAALKNAYQKASTANKRLRLQLEFEKGAQELESLPWEFLYYPDEKSFLATDTEFVLSRYMPEPGEEITDTLAPEQSPLRILVVVSQPQELDPVIATPVKEEIQKLKDTAEVLIDELENPTMDQWGDRLQKFKPHIVHWIGHGQVNQRKQGEVAFVDENGKLVWWPDMVFAEKFKQVHSIPRLVVLQMCETAKVKSAGFAGVAPWLIQFQVPAVVAMQYPIRQDAAISFSKAFYKALADGKDVDDAFQHARYTITTAVRPIFSRNFGTPILYWRSRNGIIIRSETPSPERSQQQARLVSNSLAVSSRKPEIQTIIMQVGEEEMKNLNLDEAEKMEIPFLFYSIVGKWASLNNLIEIRQKLSEELPGVSNTKLKKIILKMIDATKEKA